jgi:hypothetical protein
MMTACSSTRDNLDILDPGTLDGLGYCCVGSLPF